MDINNKILIWVNCNINREGPESIVGGIAFDGEFGFGQNNVRVYSGNLKILSDSGDFTFNGVISTAHIKGKGLTWLLDLPVMPKLPFLLTNDFELYGPIHSAVELNLSDEAKEMFLTESMGSYPVTSKGFIGILDHFEGRYQLTYFLQNSVCNNALSELSFSEWGIKVGEIISAADEIADK